MMPLPLEQLDMFGDPVPFPPITSSSAAGNVPPVGTTVKYAVRTHGIQRYDVVWGRSIEELRSAMYVRMAEGWEPQGGVCVTVASDPDADECVYYQAIIFREPKP